MQMKLKRNGNSCCCAGLRQPLILALSTSFWPNHFNQGFSAKYNCESNAYFSMCNFNSLILAPLCLFFYAYNENTY